MSANYNLLTNAYKDGYKQGYEAGLASRTPIKWPTEKEIEEASFVSDMASMHEVMAFRLGVQWLKSFVEKGEK